MARGETARSAEGARRDPSDEDDDDGAGWMDMAEEYEVELELQREMHGDGRTGPCS